MPKDWMLDLTTQKRNSKLLPKMIKWRENREFFLGKKFLKRSKKDKKRTTR